MANGDRCPYCGTKLTRTNSGKRFCPNHGIIEEDETLESKDIPSYLG